MSIDDPRRAMATDEVRRAMSRPERWDVHQVAATGSTNDDLARGSAPLPESADGTVLFTEEQTAGRGRAGRDWHCPTGAGLMFSVKVGVARIPPSRRAWVGVALGLAVADGFRTAAGVTAMLKWPNDVLVDGLKCGGILAEADGDCVVVGAGLNVSLDRSELPRPDATSLRLAGAGDVDRNRLLAAILDEFGDLLRAWGAVDGNVDAGGLRAKYLAVCATMGQRVRIELPGGRTAVGLAVGVDPDGAIVVEQSDGRFRYSAGDVVHLRPTVSGPIG